MSLLLFLFGKKSNQVSPAYTCKSLKNSSEEGRSESKNREGKKKSLGMNEIEDQRLDAESKQMVQSCVRGSNRRHGLCDSKIQEDTQLLRKRLLVQALKDANLM